jgi:hypothetical protein
MLRAALLHADTYEEVEADRSSIRQAWVVVLAASATIGVARFFQATEAGLSGQQLAFQVALSVIEPLIVWIAGSAFAFMVGASFFRGPETESDFAEVLRTTGFAFTPGLLRIFIFVPPAALGLSIDLIARLWVLVAVVVALRQALDFTTLRAVGTFWSAALLLYLIIWGLTAAPLPL